MKKLAITIIFVSLAALALEFAPAKLAAEVLQEITVKEGDTLWGISNYYLKNPQSWPEIIKYNNLPSSDPNIILPGMKLRVPILLIKENLRAATLFYIFNDVRYRRNKQAEWNKAQTNMELYNEDGLRTFQESRAKVRFFSGEVLQLDENSLIILRPEEKQEEVSLLSGGVRASRARILASDTTIDPRIEPRGPAPDFRAKIKEDKTTLVEVYDGIVDVTAQGKTVTLTKGFGTEVKFKKAPSAARALPPLPEFDVKASGSEIPGSKLSTTANVTSGSLELNIKAPSATGPATSGESGKSQTKVLSQIINKYHIQVSTSYSFYPVVIDEINKLQGKASIDFKKYILPDSIYYYRIAYVDELGFEGRFSQPVQFRIDTTAPVIELTTLKDGDEIDTEFIIVEGKTEPNASLKINDKDVSADNKGAFMTALTPKKGKNLVTLIATDHAGNTSSKTITVEKVKTASRKSGGGEKTEEKSKDKGATILSVALGILTGAVILGVVMFILGG
ncbi:MAG: LysM peptidoglycan-binding domain-containing protein [Elusimicrobiota bacterium]